MQPIALGTPLKDQLMSMFGFYPKTPFLAPWM